MWECIGTVTRVYTNTLTRELNRYRPDQTDRPDRHTLNPFYLLKRKRNAFLFPASVQTETFFFWKRKRVSRKHVSFFILWTTDTFFFWKRKQNRFQTPIAVETETRCVSVSKTSFNLWRGTIFACIYADAYSLPKLFSFFYFDICRFRTSKQCFGYFRLWLAMRVLVEVLVRDWEKNKFR